MHTSQIERVRAYYNNTQREYTYLWGSRLNLAMHFGYYDDNATSHRHALANLNAKIAALGALDSHDTVLDAGCGLGGTSLWLASHLGCRVVGINIVPWQVAYARSRAQRAHLEKLVTFETADYARTGHADASFSTIIGIESFVHASSKEAVCNETFRLLKPGGKMIICEYILKKTPLNKTEGGIIHQWLDGWAMPSLLSEDQYRSALQAAGFTSIEVHDWTEHILPSLKRLERLIRTFKPIAPIAKRFNLITAETLGNLTASQAQLLSLKLGIWRYKVIVATKGRK